MVGLYQIPIRPVVPFVGLGIGMTSLDINTGDPADQDSNRLGVSVTLGAKLYLTRRLGILCDARQRATYLGERRKSIDDAWSDRDRWFRVPGTPVRGLRRVPVVVVIRSAGTR